MVIVFEYRNYPREYQKYLAEAVRNGWKFSIINKL